MAALFSFYESAIWALEQGATFFLDLSFHYSWKPKDLYESIMREVAAEKGIQVEYRAIPTYPKRLPKPSQISMILDVIDDAIQRGYAVYVHDLYSREVAELVAGCYLIRTGLAGEEALETLAKIRATTYDHWKRSPATERARKVVKYWKG